MKSLIIVSLAALAATAGLAATPSSHGVTGRSILAASSLAMEPPIPKPHFEPPIPKPHFVLASGTVLSVVESSTLKEPPIPKPHMVEPPIPKPHFEPPIPKPHFS